MARETPPRIGTSKFLTSLTPLVGYGALFSISGGSLDHALPKMAGDFVPAADRFQRRRLPPASRLGEPASGVRAAARRRIRGPRSLAWHQQSVLPPLPRIRSRRQREEAQAIGMR